MHRGFSLIELSIVLVILGLLTGGILSGQALIRGAELRGTISQAARYQTTYYSFRDKYFAVPGDFTKATDFWTSAGGTGSDVACYSAQSEGNAATCNGNGDGTITGITGAGAMERFLSWKHLANAGLVEGSYSGKSNGAANSYVATSGLNVPAAKIGNAYFDWAYMPPESAGSSLYFSGTRLGRNMVTLYGTAANFGALKPEDAWNLDTKLDDGSPVYGKVFTLKRSALVGGNCSSSDLDSAVYDFSQTAVNCLLHMAAE